MVSINDGPSSKSFFLITIKGQVHSIGMKLLRLIFGLDQVH